MPLFPNGCRRLAVVRLFVLGASCLAATVVKATAWTNCFKVVEYSDLRHVQCTVEDLHALDLCFDHWESNRWEVIDHSGGPGVQLALAEKGSALSAVTYQSVYKSVAGTRQPFHVAFRADFSPVGIRCVYHGWLSVANTNGTFVILGSAMDVVSNDLLVGDGVPDLSADDRTHVWTDPSTGLVWTYVDYGDSCGAGSGRADAPALDPRQRGVDAVAIPEAINGRKVVKVEPYAFSECQLDLIGIPRGVTNIAPHAFRDSNWISRFVVSPENPVFTNVQDCICSKDVKEIVAVPPLACLEALPTGVETIGTNAFLHYRGSDSVTVPSSVTSVRSYAFVNSRIGRLVFQGDMPVFEPDALTGADVSMVVCVKAGTHGWPNDAKFGAHAFQVLDDIVQRHDTTSCERIDDQGVRCTDTCEVWHDIYREASLSGGKWVRSDREEWNVVVRTQQTDDPSGVHAVASTNGWSQTRYWDLEHVRTYDMQNDWKVCQGGDAGCWHEERHDTHDAEGNLLSEEYSLHRDDQFVCCEEKTYVYQSARLACLRVKTERMADGLCNWSEACDQYDDSGRVFSREANSGQYDMAEGRTDHVGIGPGDSCCVTADSAADAMSQVSFSYEIPIGEKDSPLSVSATDYIGYFKPAATDLGDGKWCVTLNLDTTAIALSESVAAILPQLSGRPADAGAQITLPCKPGLYYGIAYAKEVGGPYRCDRFVLAADNAVNLPAPSSSRCLFMRVAVSTKE